MGLLVDYAARVRVRLVRLGVLCLGVRELLEKRGEELVDVLNLVGLGDLENVGVLSEGNSSRVSSGRAASRAS